MTIERKKDHYTDACLRLGNGCSYLSHIVQYRETDKEVLLISIHGREI
jgi:hypothetical protein